MLDLRLVCCTGQLIVTRKGDDLPETLTKLVTGVYEIVCLVLGRQLLSNSMYDQYQICTGNIRFLSVDLPHQLLSLCP